MEHPAVTEPKLGSVKDWLHGTTKLPMGGPPAGSCPKFCVKRSPSSPEKDVVPGLRPYPVGVATNRGSVWERAKVERVRIATIKNFFIFFILQTFSGGGGKCARNTFPFLSPRGPLAASASCTSMRELESPFNLGNCNARLRPSHPRHDVIGKRLFGWSRFGGCFLHRSRFRSYRGHRSHCNCGYRSRCDRGYRSRFSGCFLHRNRIVDLQESCD